MKLYRFSITGFSFDFKYVVLLGFLFSGAVFSSPKQILVAGDSWAYFLCLDKGYSAAIKNNSIRNLTAAEKCLDVSKLGMQGSDWLVSEQHRKLLSLLKNNPKIGYIHLSLGGNDLLEKWNTGISPIQESILFFETYDSILKIVKSIRAASNAVIILSGYDYPRFIPNHPIERYRDLYNRLGRPEPFEINSALIRYNEYLHQMLKVDEDYGVRLFSVSHLGLSHYYSGIPGQGIPEKSTLNPDDISTIENPISVGGDFRFMAENDYLRNYFPGVYDSFHMSRIGYALIAEHSLKNIILRIETE